MRNATPAFMRALAEGRRDYVNRLAITLADGTVLQGTETTYDVDTGTETVTTTNYLTNENLWEDGMKMEDSVSADDVFQIGAAIINSATFTLNNIDDRFSPYSFDGARCIWTVGLADLDDGTSDFMQMGTFIVDETDYDGSVITLKCLDNMSKFDKPYNTTLVYPATLGAIVRDACTKCGVTLATNSLQFPHYTYQVTNKPSSESTTYRQVISWAAQIAVCFARCNTGGQLEFKFYNTSALDDAADDLDGGVFDGSTPYASGDSADGGSFNPWNTGYVYDGGNFTLYPQMHYIGSAFSHKVATDDVVITGVRVQKKIETEGSSTAYQTYTYGTDGYIVSIEGNDFIDGTHGEDVKNWMGQALVGLVFRKAEVQHPNDPTFEAGDVAYYWDRKGNRYTLLVSSTTFSCNSSQRTVSAAETPAKNFAQKFTESTRNYVEMRKQLAKQQTSWETAAEALARQIANASGLHETDVVESGATTKYYHDKPNLADSEIAMVFNDLGFFVCDDYKTKTDAGEDPSWVGLKVDGAFLARQIDTIDLFFNYASGGTLKLGGKDDVNGKLEIYDSSGNLIGTWSNNGLYHGTVGQNGSFAVYPEGKLVGNIPGVVLRAGPNGLITNNGAAYLTGLGVKANPTSASIASVSIHTQVGIPTIDFNIPYAQVQMRTNRILTETISDIFVTNTTGLALKGFDATRIGSYNEENYFLDVTVNGTVNNGPFREQGHMVVSENLSVFGNFAVSGTKSRLAETKNYGNRRLYCYETPTPYFGDIGTGCTDANGEAVVCIDDIFDETVSTHVEYSVFLQKEGMGDIWIDEKEKSYFVVKGSPNLKFSWELKAVQNQYEYCRLDEDGIISDEDIDDYNIGLSMSAELDALDNEDLFPDK